jgi:CBS domain-containing protein
MHEIAEFLCTVPPFDALEPEQLEQVAAACTIEFVPAGQTILAQSGAPATEARVVRRGAVELIDRGRVLDLLGEGEMFGHTSLLASDPMAFTIRAHEDTLCYVIPADVLRPVLAQPSGLRYVVRSVGGRFELRARDGAGYAAFDPASRSVGELVRAPLVVCEPGTPVQEAARRMAETGSSSVLVQLPGDGVGIVTDRDLRTRVVAAGAAPSTPLSEVMSAPARAVTADRTGADVLLEMLDHGVRHFPVVDAHRRLIGVISDTDLMAVETRTPFHLRAAIARADDVGALVRATQALPATVIALHGAHVAPDVISRVITTVHDALTRRLIQLAEDTLGPAPAPFTWIALGSFARREAYPSSDQDSALVWAGEDSPETGAWLRRLAERVVAGLEACGIPACPQGALASRPLFARSLARWEQVTRSWLDDPDQEKALILVSVVVDGRPVWGADVAGSRLEDVFATARERPRLLRLMQRFALAHRPPTGFFRDFVVEHDGAHKGQLDIKRGGLLPVVDLARVAAMAAGVAGATTLQRLEAAAAAGTLDAGDVAVLHDAFELFSELRMEHQVAELRAGERPDDHIDVTQLTRLTRSYLKEALRAVARIQRGLATSLSLGR